MLNPRMYTPEQAAEILQLSKNTIYQLIKSGEIAARKFGKVYRIPQSSLSFALTGLDWDIYQAEQEDLKNIARIEATLSKVRKSLK